MSLSKTFYSDDEGRFPLSPCSFCGGQPELHGSLGKYWVDCNGSSGHTECPVDASTTYDCATPAEAVWRWNQRATQPDNALRELLDGMRALGCIDALRPQVYALCIALGRYDAAESVCRLYCFKGSSQVVAAMSVRQVLEDARFAEFHSRIRSRECYELTWHARLKGHDGDERIYTPTDLVPSAPLPEIVWGDST